MWFWVTVIGSIGFAALAVKIGFFETFAAFFNALVAVYAALFFTPMVLNLAPQALEIPCGLFITSLVVAVGVFLILFTICFFLITGQFSVPFPKVFDVILAGGLGFLMGFLVLSFLIVMVSRTAVPGASDFVTPDAVTPHANYLGWWCDRMHRLVGSSNLETECPTHDALAWLASVTEQQKKSSPAPAEDVQDPNYRPRAASASDPKL